MARSTGHSRPVIKDVARLAGVSAPTVSRYLNGTVKVSEDKRERIAKAIKQLGYEPSVVARALSNQEMDTVVAFAANPSSFSTSETNHGVEAAARRRRFLLNIVSLDESDMDSVEQRVRMGLSVRPAGAVVYLYDKAGIKALDYIPKDLPLVVVGGSFGDGDYQIVNAEREGGRWMTMHLLDLKHKTVFHVARPAGPNDNTRTNGWRDALEERGATIHEPIIVSPDDLEEAVEAGRRLGERDDVTAVFAGNDETAIAVIKGLRESGRQIPDDVSVVGFDDQRFAPLWQPALTSYSQNFLEMGERAFRMLYEQVRAKREGADAPQPRVEVVEGRPCLRGSETEYVPWE
ncbi:LacI family DNA-binding transcriptional regulator [Bifidobacterium callitrichos]|uniref:LacI family DNA-binding transcriptional regulator n=1 Tax=Bifidobacterium callitrichos TaxID=762209 RepID=A0A5M9ZBZ4_9BIFI|nr:LacI family DNA-binding transcriptional regulator [Bifidobacterium callitrichos]KAA8815960.1 LacI family DNA-binding transcriptional regulator [Bifidobacterium callitrichos]